MIACTPYSEKFAGVDIFSSLRMPSGSALLTILEPEGAGLAAAKLLSLRDKELTRRVERYQDEFKQKVREANRKLRRAN